MLAVFGCKFPFPLLSEIVADDCSRDTLILIGDRWVSDMNGDRKGFWLLLNGH